MITGYVNIEQVIYEACERLGISNSEAYEARFLNLTLTALRKIETGLICSKKAVLYEPGSSSFSDSRKLLIPHDLIRDLCILDSSKKEIDTCKYSFIGKRIIFKEVQTDPVLLVYSGIEFDINDGPVISSNHFEAVVSYLVYMETTTRYHSKKAAHYEYVDSREWWQDRFAEAQGNDAFPTYNDIKETSAIYHTVKMCLKNGIKNCSIDCLDDIFTQYEKNFKLLYGILSLSKTISSENDYYEGVIDNEIETTIAILSSNDFYLDIESVGSLVLIIPYEAGLINSMKDSLNNDVFDGYFNIIKDDIRQITIYVAKNFLTSGSYKLTFGFSN